MNKEFISGIVVGAAGTIVVTTVGVVYVGRSFFKSAVKSFNEVFSETSARPNLASVTNISNFTETPTETVDDGVYTTDTIQSNYLTKEYVDKIQTYLDTHDRPITLTTEKEGNDGTQTASDSSPPGAP